MIVSVLQENLLRGLTRTGRILSAKPQLPIVQNVLLQTKENRLQIITTNLETTGVVWIGTKAEKEGGACVSSRLLTEFVLTLPPETVQLKADGEGLGVQCSGFRARIPGVSTKEFPPTPVSPGKGDKLEKDRLLSALSLVLFSAATDEGRPILTGVRISTNGKDTTLTATDGYRLPVKKLVLAGKQADAQKLLSGLYASVDKAAKTNVIKKNKASRIKSRITKKLKSR